MRALLPIMSTQVKVPVLPRSRVAGCRTPKEKHLSARIAVVNLPVGHAAAPIFVIPLMPTLSMTFLQRRAAKQ